MRKITSLVLAFSVSLIFVTIAAAIPLTHDELEISTGARQIYDSDVHSTDGQISISESKFYLKEKFKSGRLPIVFYLRSENIDLNENIPLELPTHLVANSLGLGVKLPLPFAPDPDHYFMGIDVFPSMYRDDWEWRASSFRIPFRVYGIYKKSDDFIAVVGASIRPQFEDMAVPIVGVIWRPNEKWEVDLLSSEPYVAYKLNNKWTLLTEFGYTNTEFEVTRGGQDGTVLQYRETSLGGGVKYALTSNWDAKLAVGSVFGREIRYRDGTGKAAIDSGVYTNFKLEGRF